MTPAIVATLRAAFRRDGAEGESVHAVCDALEASQARAAALAEGLREAIEGLETFEELCDCVHTPLPRLRALLAAGPEDAARELAGLRACFEARAPLCDGTFRPPYVCNRRATRRHPDNPKAWREPVWCDAHAPPGGEDLPWAEAVRGAGR